MSRQVECLAERVWVDGFDRGKRQDDDGDAQHEWIELADVGSAEVVPQHDVQEGKDLDQQQQGQRPDVAGHTVDDAAAHPGNEHDQQRALAQRFNQPVSPWPRTQRRDDEEDWHDDLVDVAQIGGKPASQSVVEEDEEREDEQRGLGPRQVGEHEREARRGEDGRSTYRGWGDKRDEEDEREDRRAEHNRQPWAVRIRPEPAAQRHRRRLSHGLVGRHEAVSGPVGLRAPAQCGP